MGIQSTHIYFENGLPKVQNIRAKFYELTGLELQLHLEKVIGKNKKGNTITSIYQIDLEKDKESIEKIDTGLVSWIGFSVEDFYRIDLIDYEGTGKSFELEAAILARYFFWSLLKTFFELDAQKVSRKYDLVEEEDRANNPISNYYIPYDKNDSFWTDLKKWKDYKEADRPKK